MLDQFTGRTAGEHAYLECTLATDLGYDYEGEDIPLHKQVDVKLPNGKLLRLPYAWLREEPVPEPERPSDVLKGMLEDTEDYGPGAEDVDDSEEYHAKRAPKKVVVKRGPGT